MTLKLEKKHVGFVLLYSVTLLILLLDVLGNVPFTVQLRKIKYVYLALMAAWYFFSLKNHAAKDRVTRKSNIVIVLGVLHTLFFGYIFTNSSVLAITYDHALELLIYYAMVYLTLTYVYETKLLLLYAQATYWILVVQLAWAGATHLNNFVNPLTYWRIFSSSLRYRFNFGFVQYGYTANYCVFALVASLLIFDILRQESKLKVNKQLLVIMSGIDFLILCMLCSTASRSGVLTVCVIMLVYVLGLMMSRMEEQKKKMFKLFIVIALVVILIASYFIGIFGSIWEDSNRDLNVTVNYPVFKEIGNTWTGMGYIPSEGFQRQNSYYGITTSSLDIYYLYLFFTTGVIGCILIGGALLYILYQQIKNVGKPNGIFGVSLFIGWLFFAYWQCNMLTYRYFSPWFYLVVLLYIIDNFKNVECKHENCIKTESEN